MTRNSRQAAEAFFARLPENDFEEPEIELLSLLQRISTVVDSLLPRSVTLQSWAERRIPQDLANTVNNSGVIYIASASKASTPIQTDALILAGATSLQDTTAAPSETDCATYYHSVLESKAERSELMTSEESLKFLESLPHDTYLFWEHDLRQVLLCYREHSLMNDPGAGSPIAQVEKFPSVSTAMKPLIDAGVPLRDWIELRMFEELEVREEAEEGTVMVFAPETETQKQERRGKMQLVREEFFDNLPDDSFTSEELVLYKAIHNFLLAWKGQNSPSPSQACQDPDIVHAKHKLLPFEVSLNQWCELRLSDDIKLWRVPNGQAYFSFGPQKAKSAEPKLPERPKKRLRT